MGRFVSEMKLCFSAVVRRAAAFRSPLQRGFKTKKPDISPQVSSAVFGSVVPPQSDREGVLATTATPQPQDTEVEGSDKYLESLLALNNEWADDMAEKDPEFFEHLAKGQSPEYLWIGCSDARVPAATILNQRPGAVFVHRNVANMVVNTDTNLMSVIQYAVTVLDVKHIMIVGHYDCGGVKAAMSNVNHQSPLENWIRNIRDVMRLHHKELGRCKTFDEKFRRLVELNVVEQSLNVFKTWAVQQRRLETNQSMKMGKTKFTYPRVHGLVFHPADGKLKQLSIRDAFNEYNGGDEDILNKIYRLSSDEALLPSSMAMP